VSCPDARTGPQDLARHVKISIIIPAYNEEKLLPRTLAALCEAAGAFRDLGWEVETVVCDNNSTDRTAEIARAAGATVVFEPVNQIGRARNRGADAATGDWLLFLDADSVASRSLLAEAAARIATGRYLFLGAVVALDAELGRVEGLLLRFWNLVSRTLGWMAGSFILVEAAGFREVGGFDLNLYAAEEVDLSRRLRRLARRRGRRCAILRQPLVSSARRMLMYPRGHVLRFFLRAILRPWSTPRSREACAMWYDGRR